MPYHVELDVRPRTMSSLVATLRAFQRLEDERHQRDANILHRVARIPRKSRTGKRHDHLKKQYANQLSTQSAREIFQLLIGDIRFNQTTPDICSAHERLLKAVRLEQRRFLADKKRQRRSSTTRLSQQE